VEYGTYGESAEGRPMHLVKVGYPEPKADVANGRNIFIVGTFHGNEPSVRNDFKIDEKFSFHRRPGINRVNGKVYDFISTNRKF